MAKEAFERVPLALADGTEVVLKPLKISALKRFMVAFGKMDDIEKGDQLAGYDVFVDCAGIALEDELKEQFENGTRPLKEKDGFLSKEYRDYLENTLDMDTIYRVIDVCAGIKLNDPKLLEAIQEAAREAEAGQN